MAGDIGIEERIIVVPSYATSAAVDEAAAQEDVRIIHRYGPRVAIAEIPPDRAGEVRGEAPGAGALEDLDPVGALGLAAFRLRQSTGYTAAKERRPSDNQPWDTQGLIPPDPPVSLRTLTEKPAALSAMEEAAGSTSASMTGKIAVGIIIVSGPTAELQFSDDEITKVIAEVQNGLGWLAAQNLAGITWIYDIHTVSVDVLPNGGDKESLWRNPAMAALGYSADWNGVVDYVQHIRTVNGTDWTYVGYFTKYPLDHFAYASLGGPRLVMQYANDGWGPDNIDRVFAHETGHIFQAPDEYGSSGCTCGGAYGISGKPNGNCQNCAAGGGVDCIMRANSWTVCTYTPWHFGFPLATPTAFGMQKISGVQIGSAPAMAVAAFDGRLYAAFQANDSSHSLYLTSSADGKNWTTPAVGYPGIKIGTAPAMANFDDRRLYIAFQANDSSHSLFVTSSDDGNKWTTPAVGYPGIKIGGAPAMTVFKGRLYIAFQADDSRHWFFLTSSADGNTWTTPAVGYPKILIGGPPAMAVWNKNLFLAFQANDSTDILHVSGTIDGNHWLTPAFPYPTIRIGSSPALAAFRNQLYVAFQGNDASHTLFTGGSQ